MTAPIVFFDPMGGGHRAQHVLAYVRRLAPTGRSALFVLHERVIAQVRAQYGADLPRRIGLVPVPASLSVKATNKDLFGGLRGLRHIEAVAEQAAADQVFLMHLDTFLPALAARPRPARARQGSGPLYSGLYFKPTQHYGAVFGSRLDAREAAFDRAKRLAMAQVLRSPAVRTVFSLDPHFVDHVGPAAGRGKLRSAPDLASPPAVAVRPADAPEAWLAAPRRLLLFGSLGPRKGVVQLLQALSIARAQLGGAQLLVCGRVERGFQETLAVLAQRANAGRPASAVHVVDRFVSDEELWWLLQACDVVLAPYQRHIGFSGVLCWAAAAGKPILTQDFGVLGFEAWRNRLGLTVDTRDPARIAQGLVRLGQEDAGSICDPALQRAFAERHTEASFADAIIGPLLNDDPVRP